MTRKLDLAIAQITGAPFAAERNRERTVALARQAFAEGAGLVVFPELIIPGYVLDGEGQARCAEPVDGATFQAWQEIARRDGAYVAGGFCERDGDRLFNSAIIVGPEGLVLHYRKLHLFAGEKKIFAPGDRGLPVAETPIGKLGLCVCYDLRFVEVVRSFALRGVELVAVPTAWVPGFDKDHWDAEGYCPQARAAAVQANLNQVYIACASQAGRQGGTHFLGSSLLVTPYGKPLLGPLSGDAQALVHAELDLDDVARARQRSSDIAPGADRRSDVYGLWIDGQRL